MPINTALLARMIGSSKTGRAGILADSDIFEEKELVQTGIPLFDVAFSGDIDGGLLNGITQFAAESKHFKTSFSLACVKAYFDKFDDAICIFYDSEFGTTPDYFQAFGIDPNRVVHSPFVNLEELKVEMANHLKDIQRGEHVIIVVDSIGLAASLKELEDAESGKQVSDMTRAKAITAISRIITPHIRLKDLPTIIINHVYDEITMFPKTIVKGGQGLYLASDRIFFIKRVPEREGGLKTGPIVGYKFELVVEKSRSVKEKSKFAIDVSYEGGISKWSGIFDLAIESGLIQQGGSWYTLVDPETGEITATKFQKKTMPPEEDFLPAIINSVTFKEFIRSKYKLAHSQMFQENSN